MNYTLNKPSESVLPNEFTEMMNYSEVGTLHQTGRSACMGKKKFNVAV